MSKKFFRRSLNAFVPLFLVLYGGAWTELEPHGCGINPGRNEVILYTRNHSQNQTLMAGEPNIISVKREKTEVPRMMTEIKLPKPSYKGTVSVEETILKRRSVRNFSKDKLPLEFISQLLWSAQGITNQRNKFRAAPSAGALYPMELYIVSPDGVFHYIPDGHLLRKQQHADLRQELANASWGQNFVAVAGISIVIVAEYGRTTWRYGNRGIRYVDMEAGHIAQNIHLQAVALNLGSVPVGAFNDKVVKSLLKLPPAQEPIYIIPVGYPTHKNPLPEIPEEK